MVAPADKPKSKVITQRGFNVLLFKFLAANGGSVTVKPDELMLPEGANLHVHYNQDKDEFTVSAVILKSEPKSQLALPDKRLIIPT